MADGKRSSHGDERGSSSPRMPSIKRKFDEPPSEPASRPTYKSVPPPLSDFELAKQKAEQIAARLVGDEFKRARTSSDDHPSSVPSNAHNNSYDRHHHPALEDRAPTDFHMKRVDVPNTKVGLVIGKGGETIRTLQQQSGAKIQVTRDAETEHGASTRQVELSGTAEQIQRAEQLIRDVVGDGALGGGPPMGGGVISVGSGEPIQIRVPNNKVGLIIGKGGETIKNLQQTSGARIQVQHDRETEPGAMERIVTLVGTKQQIDNATELIKEVIGEQRARGGGGYQQGYNRPQQGYAGYGYQQQQQQQQGYQQEYGSYYQDQGTGSYDYYQNQSGDQQTENDGGAAYNYQQGYYYDQQAYEQQYAQQGYDQAGYAQGQAPAGYTGQEQQEYATGYNYEYDQSYYDQSGAYHGGAPPAEAPSAAVGPPGESEQHQQPPPPPPPASSAQAAQT